MNHRRGCVKRLIIEKKYAAMEAAACAIVGADADVGVGVGSVLMLMSMLASLAGSARWSK